MSFLVQFQDADRYGTWQTLEYIVTEHICIQILGRVFILQTQKMWLNWYQL